MDDRKIKSGDKVSWKHNRVVGIALHIDWSKEDTECWVVRWPGGYYTSTPTTDLVKIFERSEK